MNEQHLKSQYSYHLCTAIIPHKSESTSRGRVLLVHQVRERVVAVGCGSIGVSRLLRGARSRDLSDEIQRELPVAAAIEPLERLVESRWSSTRTNRNERTDERTNEQRLFLDGSTAAWHPP